MAYVANEPTLIYNLYIDCTCIYSARVLILINTQLAISEKLLNIYTVPLSVMVVSLSRLSLEVVTRIV